jgi:hypothetical protein
VVAYCRIVYPSGDNLVFDEYQRPQLLVEEPEAVTGVA